MVIITFNEEKNIGRCIDSVKNVADEIIVVDSCSTDKTAEISQNKGAKLILQPFLGYVEQKNFALETASNDFVLSLDADEALDQQLDGLDLRARVPLRERVGAQQHRGTHDVVRIRLADAAGVAAQQA